LMRSRTELMFQVEIVSRMRRYIGRATRRRMRL